MLGDRDQKLNKRDIDADIQDVLTQKVQKKIGSKVRGVPFGSVKEDVLFQIPGPSFLGKTFTKMCGAWAREVIKSTKLGIEQYGDWVAMNNYEEIFPVEIKGNLLHISI